MRYDLNKRLNKLDEAARQGPGRDITAVETRALTTVIREFYGFQDGKPEAARTWPPALIAAVREIYGLLEGGEDAVLHTQKREQTPQ